jgi:hypothetical protein
MKHIFKGVIFLLTFNLFAQIPADTAKWVKPKSEPLIIGGFGIAALSGSNGLNQYMLNRIALGGYMPTEQIVHAEEKVKGLNRTGFILNAFTYATLSSKPDTAWRKKWRLKPTDIEAVVSTMVGAQFDKGAFQLIFRGNAPYLGQTLEFGRSKLKTYSMRTVFVNFNNSYFNNLGGKKTNFGFQIGLSQLTSYQNLKFTQGSVYTDSNRNYIDAVYSANFNNSKNNSGLGVGIGLLSNANLNWKSGMIYFSIRLNNLGVYYLLPELTKPNWV